MKRKYPFRVTICVLLLALLIVPNPLVIPSNAETEERATIEHLDILGEINNCYAITQISEVLHNTHDQSIEETFYFQIPDSAFISNFSLTIDGVTHYSEVVPKDEAKERYEEAAISGKNAGLMEARDSSVFSYSISIAANETVTVGLRYEEYLLKELGSYSYHIFLSADPIKRSITELDITIDIKSELEIIELEVQNHGYETQEEWDGNNSVNLAYSASEIELDKDFIVMYEIESPPPSGLLLDYFNEGEGYFFHVFSPQLDDIGEALDKDIIFVLDKSGSMHGEKIRQLKEAFSEITSQLPGEDSFNIILFDNDINQYNDSLLFATESEKEKANNYINGTSAGGSTNINDALLKGLEMIETYECRAPIIVFLTDGLPTAGITDTDGIRRNIREANSFDTAIFSLGFGYNVDFDFLSALSLENFGHALRIYEGKDATLQITDFYNLISTPLLRDLRFSYSEGTYEAYDTNVSHLFQGSETVVVGKYDNNTQKIQSNVTAQSKNGRMQFTDEYQLNRNQDHLFIERFWAYRKINYLLDQIKVFGEDDNLVSTVVNLSIKYNFVTPYTSLLIEINDVEDTETEEDQTNDLNDDVDHQSNDPNNNPQSSNQNGIGDADPKDADPQNPPQSGNYQDPSYHDMDGDADGYPEDNKVYCVTEESNILSPMIFGIILVALTIGILAVSMIRKLRTRGK
ncbi:MAG: VWA domain-containing protein [Thermoplasmata archaeon]|nr:MAG: VWA domain-containing protein [Thermoplasmata archaeon]